MRIVSHNVNGIRATQKRGWADWLANRGADVVCLQEVRCREKDLPAGIFGDYVASLDLGQLAGRNGVAILTKRPPQRIGALAGHVTQIVGDHTTHVPVEQIQGDLQPWDDEGRYIEVDLADVPVRVASLYLPKGASWPKDGDDAKPKYDRKMAFLEAFAKHLDVTRAQAAALGREFVVVGDFNIAHDKADLKNWRANQKTEGFLPEEREWLTSILGADQLTDVLRSHYLGQDGPYSWWSWRGQAFVNDSGWRIDYHLASKRLADASMTAVVDREDTYDGRLSDHAPVVIDYDTSAL